MKKTLFLLLLLILLIALSACFEKRDSVESKSSSYTNEYKIAVLEPSGLDISHDKNNLWVVSDEKPFVYKMTFKGKILKKIKVNGFDLEGVTVVDEQTLAVVLERTREIIVLDTMGNEIKRTKLNIGGDENSGLEGIAFNKDLNIFYVINEKNPSLLISLNSDLKILSIDTLRFSRDISGIFYDNKNDMLWMISDENQLIVKTNLSGKVIEKFKVDIVQPEGIAIDFVNGKIYIVSDNKDALYVYELSTMMIQK